LESECADVAFDFVQVVFRDALLLIAISGRAASAMKNLPLLLQQFSVIVLLINGLVLQHHQVAANSSAGPPSESVMKICANLRISGASCDSMRSPCDPSFDVAALGAECAHLSLDRVQSRILRQRLRRALRTAARLLLSCDSEGLLRCDETIGLLSPAGHETGIPNQRTAGAGSSNGNSDNRNRESCELEDLCKFAEVTNLSTIVSTSAVPANNRTDSGVYEDLRSRQLVTPARRRRRPAAAAAAVQTERRHSKDASVEKSYSRKAAAKERRSQYSWLNPQAKLHSTSSTTNRNFKMSDSIPSQRDLQRPQMRVH
uniref:Elicitin-like protein n=1 Tax=Macrostomum lignano TaxID=282301 RepID=A0A1I8JQW3_9PLAT